jgi:hypothetical protein
MTLALVLSWVIGFGALLALSGALVATVRERAGADAAWSARYEKLADDSSERIEFLTRALMAALNAGAARTMASVEQAGRVDPNIALRAEAERAAESRREYADLTGGQDVSIIGME